MTRTERREWMRQRIARARVVRRRPWNRKVTFAEVMAALRELYPGDSAGKIVRDRPLLPVLHSRKLTHETHGVHESDTGGQ